MRRTGPALRRKRLGIACTAVITMSTLTIPAQQASAATTLTCDTAALVITVHHNGNLNHYGHNEPENGGNSWTPGNNPVGRSWNVGRTVGGANGVVYLMVDNASGDLLRYHWTGTAWELFNGNWNRLVGTGWARYNRPEHRNKVTVDEKGRLYEVAADGTLKVRIWQGDDQTGNWTPDTKDGKVIATGWEKYDLITASGDGVLFARKPDGVLDRYQWHADSYRVVKQLEGIGRGWQDYNRVFSPGGDILYGSIATNGGQLMWYKWLEDNNNWAIPRGTPVGSGFYADLDNTANANSCRLTGLPAPPRPAVPSRVDAPTTPVVGTDGHLYYFYVNSQKGLVVGRQRTIGDYTIVDYNTFAEYHEFTGQPGAGVRADGTLDVLANSSADAVYRGKSGTGAWSGVPMVAQGGYMLSDPVMVRETNGSLTTYAVDATGVLYRRTHSIWTPIGTGTVATTDFTVVANGAGNDIVARFPDNTLRTARVTNGTLGAWRVIGTGVTGKPAAVAHANGDLQVFTRLPDGRIHTQRESGGLFSGTWQALGDFVSAGAPAAIIRGGGLVEVSARGTDDLVYVASQAAPAGGFRDWRIWVTDDTVTDPSGTVLPDGTGVFTWRSALGEVVTIQSSSGARPAVYAGAVARR